MFTDYKGCVKTIQNKYFFIEDNNDVNHKTPSYIVPENGQFEVINSTQDSLQFLQIDSCLYDSGDKTRCDCAVFNNDTFCFIELKCPKEKTITKNRKKAISQLEATIVDFYDSSYTHGKTLEAYASLNCKIEGEISYEPVTKQPKNKEKETYFMQELNTKLYYTTKKEFN